MTDTRYLKLLKALKNNAPTLAHARLQQFLSLKRNLDGQYTLAKEKNDEKQLAKIAQQELEVKEYIQALT